MSPNEPSRSTKQDRADRAEQMRRERDKADKRQRNVITIVIVGVVAALIATAAWAINQESGKPDQPLVAPASVTEDYGIIWDQEASTGEAATGEGEPVEVILYEDFQCPACQAFEAANGAFLQEQVDAGAITIDYRLIAFLDQASTNEYSSRAMNAALCVLDSTDTATYHEMHNLLYANQTPEGGAGSEDSTLISLAEQAGATEVDLCIEDQRFEPWVREATTAARAADVRGTPTVLIGGEKVEGAQPNSLPGIPELTAAIEAARDAE